MMGGFAWFESVFGWFVLSGIYMNARIQASTAEYCTVYEDLQLNLQWKPEYLCRDENKDQ